MNNDFDDLLRKKWEEKHFPVDDHHRQQMLALLSANQRRKRGIIWWFGGLTLAILVSGLFGLPYLNSFRSTGAPLMPADSIGASKKFMQITDGTDQENNLSYSSLGSAPHAKETAIPQGNDLTKITGTQLKSGISSDEKSKRLASIRRGPSKTNRDVALQQIFISNEDVRNNIDVLKQNPDLTITPDWNGNIIATGESGKDVAVEAKAIRNTFITSPLESSLSSQIDYPCSGFASKILPLFSIFHSLRFYAELGGGYIPAVKNNFSSGWNLITGGGITYKLGSKTNLFISAGYMMQTDGFNFERTSIVQQSGFGTRSNFNTLMPDKLHFVYSRIGVEYELRRHLFSVSGGGQWLYGAQGNIVITTADQLLGNHQSSQYAWLKTDGMRHFIWTGEALYGYRITPQMSIRGGIKYYFSSIETKSPELKQEGYYWKGNFPTLTPSFIINYHLYGSR